MCKDYVVLITSETIGEGIEELGKKLMASYLYSLNDGGELPSHILLLHTGVRLLEDGRPTISTLSSLLEKGVKILACGTCVDYLELKDKLATGEVSNMYSIRDIMNNATKVITIG